ncbi:MAG: exodeoxyribonuclease V subunit beta [Desulfobacteraceae bacterium]|nr:exodeoxyribonuclease V subunit beta [Desulfobacteraceae bacterium]
MAHQLDPLTFPLHGTRLIEASAGTGKTYTIAALYLRLVLGHGGDNSYCRPLTPPEILVVTFTNAATQELRDRIRQRLCQAAAFFRNTGSRDPYLEDLRNAYAAEKWPDNARLLDQAAQWMDEAAIFTIHSWSQRMLRQHAFDSSSPFDLELEPNEQEVLEQAACDYWRVHFYPQPAQHLAGIIELTGCDCPLALLDKVRPLLKVQLDEANDPFVMLKKREQAIEQARRDWQTDFDIAADRLRKAQADKTLNGNKYRKSSLAKWLDQLTNWVKENGPLPGVDVRKKLSYQGLKAGLNKSKSVPEHAAYSVFERLNEQLDDLKVDTALFCHAAKDIAQRFKREKQRRAQTGFDDLLTLLNDALHHPGNQRLAQVIRQQFPVALIDEFQDTDPVQYAAFSKVYLDQPDTGLFMIGDPKQAIYAFRGADIYAYLIARQATAGRHYTLGKNYRSTKGMVQSVNQLFARATEHPDGAFLFNDEIPFDPVDVKGANLKFIVNGKPVESMRLWQLPQDAPVPKTGDKGYINLMAEAFASEIVRLLNLAQQQPPRAGFKKPSGELKPLRPADIAVLVRDGNEAKAIRQALVKRRVRSVYLSDKESIFQTSEANDMLFVLRACSEPKNERFLRAALATPILELTLARLDDLNQDELAWEAEVERFCRYQRIWKRQGVLPMLRSLLHEFGVPARLLSQDAGERSLTNLLHLAELLQTQAAGLEGQTALVRWFVEQLQQPGGATDEHILRLESDEDLVQVVTIHKSKGLEYPLVFLPFICSFRQMAQSNSSVVQYHDEHGDLKWTLNPTDDDLEAADRERLAEDLRLLYVALTRAKFACWLGIGVIGSTSKKNGEASKLHLSGLGYLLSAREMIPTAMLSEKLDLLKADCGYIAIEPLPIANGDIFEQRTQETMQASALKFNGRIPSNWWIASYSAIVSATDLAHTALQGRQIHEVCSGAAESAIEDQLQDTGIEFNEAPKTITAQKSIHQFPRGAQPGTFLHDVLEWAADEGFDKLANDRQRVHDRLQQHCQRRGWDKWSEALADWLQDLLQTPLMLPCQKTGAALADLVSSNYQPELEFMFAAHSVNTRVIDNAIKDHILPGAARPQLQNIHVNGMLKGFIDLAFCHQGRYYVMDYKSNYLGPDEQTYGQNAMIGSILEHRYDLQYVLYILAMHRQLKARLEDYDYNRDMGGAVYLFLRGVNTQGAGVYVDCPPRPLIERLDNYFAGRENKNDA